MGSAKSKLDINLVIIINPLYESNLILYYAINQISQIVKTVTVLKWNTYYFSISTLSAITYNNPNFIIKLCDKIMFFSNIFDPNKDCVGNIFDSDKYFNKVLDYFILNKLLTSKQMPIVSCFFSEKLSYKDNTEFIYKISDKEKYNLITIEVEIIKNSYYIPLIVSFEKDFKLKVAKSLYI